MRRVLPLVVAGGGVGSLPVMLIESVTYGFKDAEVTKVPDFPAALTSVRGRLGRILSARAGGKIRMVTTLIDKRVLLITELSSFVRAKYKRNGRGGGPAK